MLRLLRNSLTASLRRGALNRRLLVLGFIAVITILSLINSYAPSPAPPSGRPNVITRLPLRPKPPVVQPPQDTTEVSSGKTATTTPAVRAPSPLKEALFPIRDPTRNVGNVWMDENHRQLKALFTCIELNTCGPNQGKVVILHSHHFKGGLWGWTGGEDIWARSVIEALKNMGYTYLYAEEMERALQLYQLFPDLVKMVLMEDGWAIACFNDVLTCQKNGANPDGIPVWKVFAFYFWPHPNNPLGPRWTLAPEDYKTEGAGTNNYLGYSVEPTCMAHSFIPHADRFDQAYILAKRHSYFAQQPSQAWPLEFYDAAAEATGIGFVAGAMNDADEKPNLDVPRVLPASITNYGLLPQADFIDAVAHSRLLIGVGNPATSPTPYEALCLGVPFINPIFDWDHDDPTNRLKWGTQHGGLKNLDPPYVYNVFKNDKEGFITAIKAAQSHPIDRHILPRMTMRAVQKRLGDMIENDWRAEAEVILEDRKRNGGQLFTL